MQPFIPHNKGKMLRKFLFAFLFAFVCLLFPTETYPGGGPRKISTEIDTKYTTVSNVGLTVTNFGAIGDRNVYWPSQPSCEYPRGSRIEHIYQGGIWVGAHRRRDDQYLVSTGTNDRASNSAGNAEGYEFNPETLGTISELSTLGADRPSTAGYSALAISHQDFVCDYSDRFTHLPSTGDSIQNHTPMGIKIHQESYNWNFPFVNFFVIMRYVIYNTSADTLDSVYVGHWDDPVVRNTNYVKPGTFGYFNSTGTNYDSLQRMAYSFDYNGAPGGPTADSYVGLKLLGTTPFPNGVDSIGNLYAHTYFNFWIYRLSSGGDAAIFSPSLDYDASNPFNSRYSRMTRSMPIDEIKKYLPQPINLLYLVSTGPFRTLNPGDSIEVVFAVICAKKAGKQAASLDTKDQRATLYAEAAWPQKCYQGDDVNGNNILDPGENIARRDSVSPTEYGLRYEPDPNGKITRYLLPAPPRKPYVRAVIENQSLSVYWDKTQAEESIDPISGRKDFEGYRIYRSNAGDDFLHNDVFILNAPLVGEFDRADDNIGYNTGFSQILLPQPKKFPGDTVSYYYRFPPPGQDIKMLNGWQYVYAVSAFDQGDSVNNVPSLESARSVFLLVPGTPPTSSKSTPVLVYPNPYYVNAVWDGSAERLRKIYFCNLPAHCEITVYTLAGDIVTILEHDAATYQGTNNNWFNTFGSNGTPTQFSGGEHAWDLITRNDQAIATGLYLFTVKDQDTNIIKRGKFLVVK
ncbi:MAG: hypothetical protein ACHQQQ_06800 [Bacteroidota bacterium]